MIPFIIIASIALIIIGFFIFRKRKGKNSGGSLFDMFDGDEFDLD